MSHVLRCSGYDIVKTGIVRGNDCYLYDRQGKKYVDFEAGVWCASVGHNNPRVNSAIRTQLDYITHLGYRYTNDLTEEASVEVLNTFGHPEGKCLFLSSGSEAVEFGVRVARLLSKKPLLLTLSDSYLAAYGSAGQKTSDQWYCFDWSVCKCCPHSEICDPQCRHLKKIPIGRVGGMVFEPGCTGGLVKFPPRGLIQNLVEMVKQNKGLVVVDEVTTGMGRTGSWYGFEHYLLQPDIVALGKGVGNGYPVSVVVMNPMVAERLETVGFHYAQSHQNDPLPCAVAREVIRIIREDGLVDRSKRMGSDFLKELGHLVEKYDMVKEVRGRGLMLALEFHNNSKSFSLQRLFIRLFDEGFIVGYKPAAHILRFLPPLTIKEEEIERMLDTFNNVITQC